MRQFLCASVLFASLGLVLAASSAAANNNVQDSIMEMLGSAQAKNNMEMDSLVKKQEQESARYKAAIDPTSSAKANMASFQSNGDDLAASLSSMLEMEKKHNKDTFQSLFLEQKRHDKINAQVAAQRQKVHERAVFLERLNMCLHEGPSNKKLEEEQRAVELEKNSYIQKEKLAAEERKNLEKKEASLLAKEELVSRMDAKVKMQINQEKQQRSRLEQGAMKVKVQLTDVQRKEMDMAARANLLKAREAEIERKESELRNLIASVKEQQMRFQEVTVSTNSTLPGEVIPCSSYADCAGCSASGQCGWCQDFGSPTSTGRCYDHNVNAKADGLTSGECPIGNWYSRVSDRVSALQFNAFGADATQGEERTDAIFNLIAAAKYPDFISIQEVSGWFLEKLKKQKFITNYYHMSEYKGINAPGGLLILSRFNVIKTFYVDLMSPTDPAIDARPKLLFIQVKIVDKIITIANTQLDWRSSDSRAAAVDLMAKITTHMENLLFLGDFNFDDGSLPETSKIPPTWIDMWTKLHPAGKPLTRGPNQEGFTWDPQTNWYAHYSDTNSRPSRIDRIFVRSPFLLPRTVWLVGCPGPDFLCTEKNDVDEVKPAMIPFQRRLNQVVSKMFYPSPHYGLLAHFSMFTPHC